MYNLDETKFCHKQNFTDILFQWVSCPMKDFSNGPQTTSWNNVMFKAEYEQESPFKKKLFANMWSRNCHFMMSVCLSRVLIAGFQLHHHLSYPVGWFSALSTTVASRRMALLEIVCVTFIREIQHQTCLFCPVVASHITTLFSEQWIDL